MNLGAESHGEILRVSSVTPMAMGMEGGGREMLTLVSLWKEAAPREFILF